MIVIIDEKRIQDFKDRVYQNRISLEDMTNISRGELPWPVDNPLYTDYIGPYKVCFIVEQKPVNSKAKIFKHISISGRTKGKLPNLVIIDQILNIFEFNARVKKSSGAHIYIEDFYNGKQAINVMEAHIE